MSNPDIKQQSKRRMEPRGIYLSLLTFAEDEGAETALDRITEWATVCDDIAAVSVVGYDAQLCIIKDALEAAAKKIKEKTEK